MENKESKENRVNFEFTEEEKASINLEEVMKEASTEYLLEKKRMSNNVIKKFILKSEYFAERVKWAKKELLEAERKRDDAIEKLSRIRQGDWGVLKDFYKQAEQEEAQKRAK